MLDPFMMDSEAWTERQYSRREETRREETRNESWRQEEIREQYWQEDSREELPHRRGSTISDDNMSDYLENLPSCSS
jgi:hypothetical protein